MFFKEPVIFPYAQYKKIIFTFLLYFHKWRTNVYIIFRYSPPAWLYTSSFIQRAYSYLPKKKKLFGYPRNRRYTGWLFRYTKFATSHLGLWPVLFYSWFPRLSPSVLPWFVGLPRSRHPTYLTCPSVHDVDGPTFFIYR